MRTAWMAMLAAATLVVSACGNSGGDGSTASNKMAREEYSADMPAASPMAPPPPPAMDMVAQESAVGSAAGGVVNVNQQIIQQDPNGGGGQPAQLIAYTYNYGFQVPPVKMEGLLNAHKAACEAAGPAKCYVINSSIQGLGQESSYGNMTMRAAPDWIKSFQSAMPDSLKQFEATLDNNNESAEDLTVQIVDSEARLRSMKTMRDRLQELLRDRPGRLSDLLEIEREFARVQADIDSHESVLAALRLRVQMSVLSLAYQPKYTAASESIWRPLGDAFGNFIPNMASTLAGIVEFIGEILPVVLVLALAIWLVVLFLRWMGRRKKPKPSPLAVKPATSAGQS